MAPRRVLSAVAGVVIIGQASIWRGPHFGQFGAQTISFASQMLDANSLGGVLERCMA